MDRIIAEILDGKGIDGIYGKIDELLMDQLRIFFVGWWVDGGEKRDERE